MNDKAEISLDVFEWNELGRYDKNINLKTLHGYVHAHVLRTTVVEYIVSYDAEDLSKLLYFLPPNHYLRPMLQMAGDNKFGKVWIK